MIKEIRFSNLIYTPFINKCSYANIYNTLQNCTIHPVVSFHAKQLNKYSLLNKISGGISKESLDKINFYYNKYKSSDKDPNEIKTKLVSKYDNLFSQLEYGENDTELSKLTPKLAKKIKDTTLNLVAVNELISQKDGCTFMPSYKAWFDTDVDKQSPFAEFAMYRHPADTIIALVGLFNSSDKNDIIKLQKQFIMKSNKELFNQKMKVLTEIDLILKNKRIDFVGQFSDNQLNLLKHKAKMYYAMNSVHAERGIYTKAIESVFFSEDIPEDISNNPIINGLGLIKGRIKIKKSDLNFVNALLVARTAKSSIEFSLYDETFLNRKEEIKKELSKEYDDENINKVNEYAKNIIKDFKNAKISNIRFILFDKEKGIKSKINKLDKVDYIDITEVLKDDNEFYYVHDFENMHSQKYINGGIAVAKEMLKFLKNKRPAPLIIQALAFNRKKRSPFKLYYRYGFIPYSHSKEEIEKLMQNNNGEFPIDVPVSMYLKSY